MLNIFNTARQSEDLALFVRHVAGAMQAKVPLPDILRAYLMECERSKLARAVEEMLPRVEAGIALSEAMKRHPGVFPPIVIRMVYLGEQGGALGGIMDELADSLEKGLKNYEIARRCAIYPLVAITLVFMIFSFLNIFIIPKFDMIFEELGADTNNSVHQTAMEALSMNILLLVPIFILLGAVLGLRLRFWSPGKKILGLPVVGHVLRLLETTRFAHNLALLIRNNVPMNEALELISITSGNTYTQAAVFEFKEGYEKGERLSDMMSRQPLFPPSMAVLIASAEDKGGLADTLEKLGDHYGERTNHAATVIREIAEPLLIILAGILIAFSLAAVYTPLFNIPKAIS